MNAEARVARAGSALPIFFIGDSSTLIHRNRLYKTDGSAQQFIGRSIYLPGMHGVDMCTSTGVIHSQVIAAMALENLLVVDTTGHWRSFDEDISIVTKLLAGVMGFGKHTPPIVFCLGGFDCMRLMEEFGSGNFEIELPEFVPQIGGSPVDGAATFAFERALEIAKRYVEPYGRALAQLKSYGLTKIFVHDVSPPGSDDAEWGRLSAIATVRRSRYAVAILFNYLLRVMCEYVGVTLIELWPRVVGEDGYVNPYYERDPIHLNSRASLLTLGVVLGGVPEATQDVPVADATAGVQVADSRFNDDYDFAAIAVPDFEHLSETTQATG